MKQAFQYILIFMIIVGILSTLIFELCPNVFLFIFGNGGEEVDVVSYQAFTYITFRIYLGFILFTCIIKVVAIFFQAIGSPIKAIIISMARDIVFIVPTAILLVHIGGIDLFLWSGPIADILGMVIVIILTVMVFREMTKKEQIKA